MKSIVQGNREGCFVCGRTATDRHHIFFGTANREMSEKYKLTVNLCHYHHEHPMGGVHFNPELNELLRQKAREAFEREYPDLDFEKIFVQGVD